MRFENNTFLIYYHPDRIVIEDFSKQNGKSSVKNRKEKNHHGAQKMCLVHVHFFSCFSLFFQFSIYDLNTHRKFKNFHCLSHIFNRIHSFSSILSFSKEKHRKTHNLLNNKKNQTNTNGRKRKKNSFITFSHYSHFPTFHNVKNSNDR